MKDFEPSRIGCVFYLLIFCLLFIEFTTGEHGIIYSPLKAARNFMFALNSTGMKDALNYTTSNIEIQMDRGVPYITAKNEESTFIMEDEVNDRWSDFTLAIKKYNITTAEVIVISNIDQSIIILDMKRDYIVIWKVDCLKDFSSL